MLNKTASNLAKSLRVWLIHHASGPNFLIFLAVLIGLGGGLGSWGFRELIDLFQGLLLDKGAALLGKHWLLPLIPALGGFIVGFIVFKYAKEAKGHGVPEVMAAVATQGGRIRPRVVIIKCFASAICIGSGGSVGREGPIVQIGSALGSSLGQLFGLTAQHLRILVGCGAAAGISATFNAPIAGALFALEVILGDFRIRAFTPIIISSVLATAFARSVLGNEPAFLIPTYQLVSPIELVFYLLLAVITGLAAVGFTKVLYYAEDKFEAFPVSEYAKPVIGGLLVGIIGIFLPHVFGVGYEAITETVKGNFDVLFILALFAFKFLATCLTLASGGSGGVFAPSLFLGAMIGGAFGFGVHALFPSITAQPGAYALVGMGAVVAGTTHAPLTAMLILFELTNDYKIILPLMLATTIGTVIARSLDKNSIYTQKLARRGLNISQGVDKSILQTIKTREVLNPQYDFVKASSTLGKIVDLLQHGEFTDFPVLDNEGVFQGVISFDDLRAVMMDKSLYNILTATDVMNAKAPVAHGDDTLLDVLKIFSDSGLRHIPVLDDKDERRLIGVLTQARLMRRYEQELRKRTEV